MKSTLSYFALAILLAAGTTAFVCGLWSRLPWKEYESVVRLRCYENNDGRVRYGFSDGKRNVHLFEILDGKRNVWQSTEFREMVIEMLRKSNFGDTVKSCVEGTEIRIAAEEACVTVVARSKNMAMTCECANGFANAIVNSQTATERRQKAQGIIQLERNCDKQAIYVKKIASKLNAAKALGKSDSELAGLKDELVKQQKLLEGMQEGVDHLKGSFENGLFFDKLTPREGDASVVPPIWWHVFTSCLCGSLLVVLVLQNYGVLKN